MKSDIKDGSDKFARIQGDNSLKARIERIRSHPGEGMQVYVQLRMVSPPVTSRSDCPSCVSASFLVEEKLGHDQASLNHVV
jgi:hypothetical protein